MKVSFFACRQCSWYMNKFNAIRYWFKTDEKIHLFRVIILQRYFLKCHFISVMIKLTFCVLREVFRIFATMCWKFYCYIWDVYCYIWIWKIFCYHSTFLMLSQSLIVLTEKKTFKIFSIQFFNPLGTYLIDRRIKKNVEIETDLICWCAK